MRPHTVALASLLLLAASASAQRSSTATVQGVHAVGMTVSDMDRSVEFYRTALTFRVVADTELVGDDIERVTGLFGTRARVVRMQLGDEQIQLTQYLAPRGRPIPVDSRSNDRWFQHVAIIVRDMDQAYARLRQARVEHASSGPQRLPDWNPNAGGIEAFYFKDPDAHVLEILEFPKGKGSARWHRQAGDTLFLGIDHTAIVTSSTDASVTFYRDVLGLAIVGSSENHGTEQEHLNNVFGARLRITALRAPEGPGVELLEYLAPSDGRPYPVDSRANDVWQWETTMVVPDAGAATQRLRAAHARFTTAGVVSTTAPVLGVARTVAVRDPDGHVVRLVELSRTSP